MKYKHLKVDMDYCSDPIWVSNEEESPVFINGSLREFEGVLSKGLLHGLSVYQRLWESSQWPDYLTPTDMQVWPGDDLVDNCLDEMRILLAAKLKEELPDVRVYYSDYDLLDKWVLVEIGTATPKGIRKTLVG